MRSCLWLRKCWYWFSDCRQSDKNSQQDEGKGMLEGSDVVETVTSETETWLKFRDKTETLSET